MKLLVVSAYHKTSPVCSALIALTAAEPTVSGPSVFTPPAPVLFKQLLVLISDPATALRKPARSRYKGRHLCLNFAALVGSSWNKEGNRQARHLGRKCFVVQGQPWKHSFSKSTPAPPPKKKEWMWIWKSAHFRSSGLWGFSSLEQGSNGRWVGTRSNCHDTHQRGKIRISLISYSGRYLRVVEGGWEDCKTRNLSEPFATGFPPFKWMLHDAPGMETDNDSSGQSCNLRDTPCNKRRWSENRPC